METGVGAAVPADRLCFIRDGQDIQDRNTGFIPRLREGHRGHGGRQIQLHHEEHEDKKENPGTPLSAAALKPFAFGDQRLAVGSRPAGRRWQVTGNNYLFAGETRTVPGSPSRPSSRTFN